MRRRRRRRRRRGASKLKASRQARLSRAKPANRCGFIIIIMINLKFNLKVAESGLAGTVSVFSLNSLRQACAALAAMLL